MAYEVHLLECDRWCCDKCHKTLLRRAAPFDIPDFQWKHLDTTNTDERYTGCSYAFQGCRDLSLTRRTRSTKPILRDLPNTQGEQTQ